MLDKGTATRTQVARMIESTFEYRADEADSLYSHYLHRQADPAGLAVFTNLLAQGVTLEQVSADIAGSPEYFQSRGSGTDTGFLAALYEDALHRAPDLAGMTLYGQALAQGVSRAQVAADIFGSAEYRRDLVKGYYERYLNRQADTFGLDSVISALAHGAHDEDVVAAILGSSEFLANL